MPEWHLIGSRPIKLAPYIALSIDDSLRAKLQDFERAIGDLKTEAAHINNYFQHRKTMPLKNLSMINIVASMIWNVTHAAII